MTVVGLVAARASDGTLVRGGLGEARQWTEGHGSGPMHSGAQGHFHRLHIHATRLFALGKDAAQQYRYSACNVRMQGSQ